ncbi:MAG: hypothetical protein B6244_01275 [Candidatus Cloacimonetes bacterium 4572_55]|nr:MAG: hypothetical protein B6244_01275 [Candidatus Cloacimonetes bacterium 4572_55]
MPDTKIATDGRQIKSDQPPFVFFSKTILTQSLLNLGLDVDQAYGIATAITESLNLKENWLKREIAEKVATALSENFGENVARIYKAPQEPGSGIRECPADQPLDPNLPRTEKDTRILEDGLLVSDLAESDAVTFSSELTRILEVADKEAAQELPDKIFAIQNQFARIHLIRRKFKKKLQDLNKPIVLLIGGGTGCGKSTLAAEIGYQLGITKIISTDSIREIMRSIFSHKIMPPLHISSYEGYRRPGFENASVKETALSTFIEQAMYVRVGAQALIERNIVEHVDMIVDGVHLIPGVLEPVNASDAVVIPLLISIKDVECHRKRFAHRERRAKDRPAKKYLKNFEAIRIIQDHLIQVAQQREIPIFDNKEISASTKDVINHIFRQLELAKKA